MSSGEMTIVTEQSDTLLSGALVAIRGIELPVDDEARGAVAVTLTVAASQCQVSEDGKVTATLLIAPDEALGVSRWLREAAISVEELPPLFEWDPKED